MPIKIVRNDITKMEVDAIVNAANTTLLGGGGVDGAIHRAAGRRLLLECMKLGGCKVGEAKITKGYNLPARFVIHTVGPRWRGGENGEKELLESCYRESLKIAADKKCESVAFPLISSGVYGYPKDAAMRVAIDTIMSFLTDHDMLVYIVIFDKSSVMISEKLFSDITSYIDDRYVDENFVHRNTVIDDNGESQVLDEPPLVTAPKALDFRKDVRGTFGSDADMMGTAGSLSDMAGTFGSDADMMGTAGSPTKTMDTAGSLTDMINQLDESFSQMLLRKIDEKGMTDAECYKKANVDRKLFSKIRNDIGYRPSKTTVIAFAIALELGLDETKELLMKAGFALSHSSKSDIIIEYFITKGNYNIFEINEALFAFDQKLLGA